MSRAVREVVVVGRDAPLWLAVLALARAVVPIDVRVRAIELPSRLSAADAYAALPSLAALHDLLGLPEQTVLQASGGAPVLGQRFSGWGGDAPAFMHAYDIQRPGIEDVDFLQFWVRARGQGLRVPLEDFSLAAAAAKQGRIGADKSGPDTLRGFSPGYHLDARRYTRLLRNGALAGGIEQVAGELASVETREGRIVSVTLGDGQRVEGDLFVDATGAEALLIGALDPGGPAGWGEWLPCDRLLRASAPPLRPLPAFAQVTAFEHGWFALMPLRERTAVVAAWRGEEASADAVAGRIEALSGSRLTDIAPPQPFVAGGRPAPWVGNCVAVGGAAATLEPLDAVELQILQIGVTNLVSLWPRDAEHMPEASAYNGGVTAQIANVRDFQIAHYRLNGRTGERFWDRARGAEPPATLAAKLSAFGARGIVPLYDGEAFEAQNWSAVFVGHGLIPRSSDPVVDAIPAEEQMSKFRRLLQVIADEVRAMPTVEAYLAGQRRAA